MRFANYEALKQAIIAYAENDEQTFQNQIPNFIRSAETDIHARSRHHGFPLPHTRRRQLKPLCSPTGRTAPNVPVALPEECLSVLAIGWSRDAPQEATAGPQYAAQPYRDLSRQQYGFVTALYNSPSSGRGDYNRLPACWALINDSTILICPVPFNAPGTLHLYYQARVPSVAPDPTLDPGETPPPPPDDPTTRWLLDNAGGALLYGALYYAAALFMKAEGDQAIATKYKETYTEFLNAVEVLARDQSGVPATLEGPS